MKNFTRFILSFLSFFLLSCLTLITQPQWHNFVTDDLTHTGFIFHENYAYFPTRGGLVQINKETDETFIYTRANSAIPSNYIASCRKDEAGNLWLNCDGTLTKYENQQFTVLNNLLPDGTAIRFSGEIHFDSKGNIYSIGVPDLNVPQQPRLYKMDTDENLEQISGTQYLDFDCIRVSNFLIDAQDNQWLHLDYCPLLRISDTDTIYFDEMNSPLTHQWTTKITEDADGRLIVFQHDYINGKNLRYFIRYDGNEWKEFSFDELAQNLGFGSKKWTYTFAEGHKAIWYMIEDEYLLYYDLDTQDQEMFSLTNTNFIGTSQGIMDVSPNGHIWISDYGFDSNRILEYDGTNWIRHTTSNANLYTQIMEEMTFDQSGNFWVINFHGISSYDGTNWENFGSGLDVASKMRFEHIRTAPDGSIWISGSVNGSMFNLVHFDGINWNWLSSGQITNLEGFDWDEDGNMWIGSSHGLYKFNGNEWTLFDETNSGIPSNVKEVLVDSSNDIWICTYLGFYHYDGANFEEIILPFDGISKYVWWAYEDYFGNIWVMFSGGFAMLDGMGMTLFDENNSPLDPGSITGMVQDSEDTYWFATCYGLYEYDGVNWIKHNKGISPGCIRDIEIDQFDNIWMTTSQTGIVLFNKNGIGNTDNSYKGCLTGQVFLDSNENGTKDPDEVYIFGQKIKLQPSNEIAISSFPVGKFNFNINEIGQYAVTPVYENGLLLTTDSLSYTRKIEDGCHENLNFGFVPEFPDVRGEVFLTPPFPRCNQESPLWISYKNIGLSEWDGFLSAEIDPLLEIVDIQPTPVSISADSIVWEITDLKPLEMQLIKLIVIYPDANFIGEELEFEARLYGEDPNGIKLLDTDNETQILVCSFDPNDKSYRSTGLEQGNLALLENDLEYLIRFENTGNDTAFQVIIRDTIEESLNIETFELLGASHPVSVNIRNSVVEFLFEDILLPFTSQDSINSHGFVKFRISPKEGLPNNTEILNEASIYFDFNLPIVTNTTQTILVEEFPTNIFEPWETNQGCLITPYPNPFVSSARFDFESPIQDSKMFLYDALGRLIFIEEVEGSSYVFKRNEIPAGLYFFKFEGELECQGKLIIVD